MKNQQIVAFSTAINEVKETKRDSDVVNDRGGVVVALEIQDQGGGFEGTRDLEAVLRPYDRMRVTMVKSQSLSSG